MLVSLQSKFNLLNRQIDMAILEVCRNYEIPRYHGRRWVEAG